MGEILGLGVTHYPGLLLPDRDMPGLLRRTLADSLVPARAKDPSNWPAPMRAEWGEDGGETAARAHREHCFAAFRAVRRKLDEFHPDFVMIIGDDQYENFLEDVVPPFCLQILDDMSSTPFEEGFDSGRATPNIWNDPTDTVFRHRGHPEGGRYIVNRLSDEGVFIPYAYRLRSRLGLAHAFINTLMYLDADRTGFDYPVVPLHVNCYGGSLVRSQGGRIAQSTLGAEPDPPAPSARACFDLGRAIGRVLKRSPWRVALIGSSSWSHAFLTRKNDWIHPDHESDRVRLEELRQGQTARWRDLGREELEDAGQHEFLNWITLAGAMTEIGRSAEIIAYVETWVLNSNKCFASWQ